ncbi:MAG: hypothetical protein AB1644_08315 [Candidatus Zixiibacteriota bacterium]
MPRTRDSVFKLMAITLLTFLLVAPIARSEPLTADHLASQRFVAIPPDVIRTARSSFTLFYGHTSHGSQILTGMQMLLAEDTLYAFNAGTGTLTVFEYGDDLGTMGDTSWVPITRQRLDQPGNTINVVMWSWCGGQSDNDSAGTAAYLDAMDGLEQEYPGVVFVYMTGHLDGGGPAGNLYVRNNQIRNYCLQNGKVLFDFADIESYSPDGTYYPYESDACAWCADWCATNACPDCAGCAHSHCFNCYQKGKAFWWLLARLSGWTEVPCCTGTRGNTDGDFQDIVDISDLTAIVEFLFQGQSLSYCPDENNVDGVGSVDISDLQQLVDFLFVQGMLTACP